MWQPIQAFGCGAVLLLHVNEIIHTLVQLETERMLAILCNTGTHVRKYHMECRLDVWSSGVILYILLSGVPPFWAGTCAPRTTSTSKIFTCILLSSNVILFLLFTLCFPV